MLAVTVYCWLKCLQSAWWVKCSSPAHENMAENTESWHGGHTWITGISQQHGLKGTRWGDGSRPENVGNVQIASFACSVNIYAEYLFCFEFELLRKQLYWLDLYQGGAEKGWIVTYLILLPQIPLLFMTSLIDCRARNDGGVFVFVCVFIQHRFYW